MNKQKIKTNNLPASISIVLKIPMEDFWRPMCQGPNLWNLTLMHQDSVGQQRQQALSPLLSATYNNVTTLCSGFTVKSNYAANSMLVYQWQVYIRLAYFNGLWLGLHHSRSCPVGHRIQQLNNDQSIISASQSNMSSKATLIHGQQTTSVCKTDPYCLICTSSYVVFFLTSHPWYIEQNTLRQQMSNTFPRRHSDHVVTAGSTTSAWGSERSPHSVDEAEKVLYGPRNDRRKDFSQSKVKLLTSHKTIYQQGLIPLHLELSSNTYVQLKAARWCRCQINSWEQFKHRRLNVVADILQKKRVTNSSRSTVTERKDSLLRSW